MLTYCVAYSSHLVSRGLRLRIHICIPTVDPGLASSIEGGNPSKGVSFCIPSTENGWQGGTMSSCFKPTNKRLIKVGEKFVVKIVGWNCDTQMPDPLTKRKEVSPRANLPGTITVGGGK